jgi:hypothetical protein
MFYDGFCRGGAQIALAPEVLLTPPGPGVHLYYGRNDAWALGMVCHELLSSPGHTPFEQMEHPETYSDDGFRPVDQALSGEKQIGGTGGSLDPLCLFLCASTQCI